MVLFSLSLIFIPTIDAKANEKVCALYFADAVTASGAAPTRFIQGSYHNNPNIVKDNNSCSEWIKKELLSRPNCAQPVRSGKAIVLGVLIDKSKHSFDLPANLLHREVVIDKQLCGSSNREDVLRESYEKTIAQHKEENNVLMKKLDKSGKDKDELQKAQKLLEKENSSLKSMLENQKQPNKK